MDHHQAPRVTREDVRRIIRREFPSEDEETILSLLDDYEAESGHPTLRDRVHLAILKLSRGNIDRLLHGLQVAISDYRDVLAPAEYPRQDKTPSLARMPSEEVERIQEEDWKEYQSWLHGE